MDTEEESRPFGDKSSANGPKEVPKPAIFIARKLVSDFVELAGKKIEAILAQETKDKPIFESLSRDTDPTYDEILFGLGAISEHCLPSLLKILLSWYHHQIDADEIVPSKRPQSLVEGQPAPGQPTLQQQQQQFNSESQVSDCGSPSNDTLGNFSSIAIRSPTPSSPDISNQTISITSTLPLDYQSPSLTIVGDAHSSSAANTSTSTATNVSSNSLLEDSVNSNKRIELYKARKMLVEYTFCQALMEIFGQLDLHPGLEELLGQVEDMAFEHFKYVEGTDLNGVDLADVNLLVSKFAELVGILARSRFKSIKRRFMSNLNELRANEMTPYNIQCIVSLLSGMRFFRVKMAPIEEFEASFQLLQECADFFLETRHKSIKHALADLFVEILLPLASTVKNEVKIPCLKNFVDTLWPQTLDMCSRKKHSITMFPLVTCLLCMSQRSLFLSNWGSFLNMCLSNLKNRDQRMCRVALESLYRLIWIYMIRVKCESNNITQARLNSIIDTIFPRGSRTLNPRDAPLSMFVDIIHFIAQERLDFAMRNIIFELLAIDRPAKVILMSERMNIALQAFLVIADSLQQKDGEPELPRFPGQASDAISGGRRKRTNKMLTDDMAKSIGIYPYCSHIKKSFNDILKALDLHFGRPLLLNASQNCNKDADDVITSERKPKVELFKTCIAAIPRLMPEGMSKADLIDLLSRMTIHVDEEMRKCAFESLQILITDFTDWRLDAVEGYTLFLANQIDESMRLLIDSSLRILLQLLISWRSAITPGASGSQSNLNSLGRSVSTVSIQTGYETISSRSSGTGGQIAARKNRALAEMRLIQSELSATPFDRLVNVIQKVEAASLVMLCSCHQPTRKIASELLHECRSLLKSYSSWTCMEHFGFRSPDEADEEDLSASIKGSLSADNLSRITTTSAGGPQQANSMTSMNTAGNFLSTSVSKMCLLSSSHLSRQNDHDPYDGDFENHPDDGFTGDDNTLMIFWLSVIILASNKEQEYTLGLALLKKILPTLPFEQPEFTEQMERTLRRMNWTDFPGIHPLLLKGCTSASTYDISIALLDQLTPILRHPICTANKAEESLVAHILTLLTHLLSEYDDPSAFSLNIARRIALCCEENSQKLENLSAVMNLYSRRSFSKDGFQWIKCVVKYLHDAYPTSLPKVISLLMDMFERGPETAQQHIAPILYCIFTYVDTNGLDSSQLDLNEQLTRLYIRSLNGCQWRGAVQIFRLLISKSARLADSSNRVGGALPGRIMDFELDF